MVLAITLKFLVFSLRTGVTKVVSTTTKDGSFFFHWVKLVQDTLPKKLTWQAGKSTSMILNRIYIYMIYTIYTYMIFIYIFMIYIIYIKKVKFPLSF